MKDWTREHYVLLVIWIIISLCGITVGVLATHRPWEERVGVAFFASLGLITQVVGGYIQSRFEPSEYVDRSESDVDDSEYEKKEAQKATEKSAKTGTPP